MPYLPKQGDIVKINFDPQSGHEQRGRRPALVVSNDTFNGVTNMRYMCPITNTNNGFPLHVPLDQNTQTTGFIECEHMKSMDSIARNAAFIERAPENILNAVIEIISLSLKK